MVGRKSAPIEAADNDMSTLPFAARELVVFGRVVLMHCPGGFARLREASHDGGEPALAYRGQQQDILIP